MYINLIKSDNNLMKVKVNFNQYVYLVYFKLLVK